MRAVSSGNIRLWLWWACLSSAFGFRVTPLKLGIRYNADNTSASTTKLSMVRNIDLPEAIVFYGIESMMEHSNGDSDDDTSLLLRPGIVRLLNECRDVGTAALLLSEELDDESTVKQTFERAWETSSSEEISSSDLQKITEGDERVLHFRCLNSKFVCPVPIDNEQSDEFDENIEFYNLQSIGRSPSPAFLLDSLRSVHIDPRGFGGSSGFGRGQWVEPRRSPMTARTVVFIAGDWVTKKNGYVDNDTSRVKDRCAASRAAGCRVIYLEHLSSDQILPVSIEDDTDAMSLCDAVLDSFGNNNPRDLQPVSLDAISTPGDYWLNPPNPRDDIGNAVSLDEIVAYFRAERDMEDSGCVVDVDADNDDFDDEMSEDEMAAILADLDVL
ncbi:hypothetical protein ACHAWC_007667 [Mediolabrus comicus]